MATVRSTMLSIILVAALVQSATAKTFTVGDTTGWTIPDTKTFYDEWAAKQTFAVGDKLKFVYSIGHNVYQVSAADAENCDGTNPVAMFTAANPTIELTEAGEISYICEVIGHCSEGMKMTLTVSANGTLPASAETPSSTPSVSPPAPSTPSAGSGVRSTAAAIVGALLAVGAALVQ